MHAVQIQSFGTPKQAQLIETTKPVPKPGQLLIKLKACSINPVDVQIRQGHYQELTPLPFKLGFDGAGIIEQVGEQVGNEVSDFSVGQRVYFVPAIFNGEGTYAEYCVVDAQLVAAIPESLSFTQAAALSLAGSAAWECLIDRGRLQAQETVFIHAGAGGVGHIAIQIAKAIGAKVITSARKAHHSELKSLGADIVLDHHDSDFSQQLQQAAGDGVHLVLDTVGGNAISEAGQILLPYGRIISLADYCPPQDLLALWPKNVELHLVYMAPSAERLQQLNTLVDQGKLKVNIDKTFPLTEADLAHAYMDERGRSGKVVLEIS